MRRLSARWVWRLLTIDHERSRVTTLMGCLWLFNHNLEKFLRRFITVNYTRVHYSIPEIEQQSKPWVSPGESGPNKGQGVSQQSDGDKLWERKEQRITNIGASYLSSLKTIWRKNDRLQQEERAFPPRQCKGVLVRNRYREL